MTKQLTTALLLILLITPCLTHAQKKELSQARSIIKSGNDYGRAEELMKGLLKDSTNKDNEKIYLLWFEAVRGQYNQANERLYLKQNQDTAAFFNLNRRMFTILETLDSIDMRPDKKGRVDIEYRQKHAEILNVYRPNLFNAGTFHLRKGEYQTAYEYFEQYIDCDNQPLFTGRDYLHKDNKMKEAAYWATYAAYKMNDAVLTLRHRHMALNDSAKANFTLQYIAEARRWLNDKELYVKSLEEGFNRYPTFSYFFPRLIDAYSQEGELEKALQVTDKAIEACDTCSLYYFAKSTILLRLGRYQDCIDVCKRLLSFCPELAEVYFNAGTSYINLALELDERKDKKKIRQLYQEALPYMEQYRRLAPKELEKWGSPLYRIYFNLNMGKQFDEIDRLLKQ